MHIYCFSDKYIYYDFRIIFQLFKHFFGGFDYSRHFDKNIYKYVTIVLYYNGVNVANISLLKINRRNIFKIFSN